LSVSPSPAELAGVHTGGRFIKSRIFGSAAGRIAISTNLNSQEDSFQGRSFLGQSAIQKSPKTYGGPSSLPSDAKRKRGEKNPQQSADGIHHDPLIPLHRKIRRFSGKCGRCLSAIRWEADVISTLVRPAGGFDVSVMRLKVVVFPAPFGPMRLKTSPD
jgi:hypothetical protein